MLPRPINYLAGLPAIIPNGKLQPPGLDPAVSKRLAQLESDRDRLQDAAEASQKAKRASLREWEKLIRESRNADLRSELAEEHLTRLSEEGQAFPAATELAF